VGSNCRFQNRGHLGRRYRFGNGDTVGVADDYKRYRDLRPDDLVPVVPVANSI
jgi:hypothetical protein